MTLNKASLSSALEDVLTSKQSLDEAVVAWGKAYVSYAQNAMSTVTSLPTNAMGNLSILQGAFLGAFQSQTAPAAAAAISAGIMSFWTAIIWVGPTASGATIVPGNFSLSGSLTAIFANSQQMSEAEKATALAGAFDTGAKQVLVLDVPYAQPAPPISGPIS